MLQVAGTNRATSRLHDGFQSIVGITIQSQFLRSVEVSVRDTNESERSQSMAKAVLTDAHFWIPIFVLLGGLAVLRWIS